MYYIYALKDPDNRWQMVANSLWDAVEQWLDETSSEHLEDFFTQKAVLCVKSDWSGTIQFTLIKKQDEFVAERVDGLGFGIRTGDDDHCLACHGVEDTQEIPNETFHLGLSCYGPDKDSRFRGAISVDGHTLHSETYASLRLARVETVNRLVRLVGETLGFSRRDVIERLCKEACHGRQSTGDNEGAVVDG